MIPMMVMVMMVVRRLGSFIGLTETDTQAVRPDETLLTESVADSLDGNRRHLKTSQSRQDGSTCRSYKLTFEGGGYPRSFDVAQDF